MADQLNRPDITPALGLSRRRPANRQSIQKASYEPALAVLSGSYAVIDIETTGLDPNRDEIIEIAALVVTKSYVPVMEFSTLVRPQRPVPPEITRLTGIEQRHLDDHGKPLAEALRRFSDFVGDIPLFAHHAEFDQVFLARAAQLSGLTLANPMHDTIYLARAAWPGLDSYRLSKLVETLRVASLPTHRALDDAKAALAVLLEAKKMLSGSPCCPKPR